MKRVVTRVTVIALLALAYFAAGKFGLSMARFHASASPVWPGTGIALAAVLLLGYRVWPGIFLGAFLVNVTATRAAPGNVGTGLIVAQALGIAIGNTLEALLGAWLVERFAGGKKAFERVSSVFYYAFLAAALSAALSASIGTLSLLWTGLLEPAHYGGVWLTWWMGDMVSAVVLAPFLIVWATSTWSRVLVGKVCETGVLLLVLFLVLQVAFSGWIFPKSTHYPLSFLLLPILVWTALRFDLRGVVLVALIISCNTIAGTLRGFGPFVLPGENDSLLLLQAFMYIVTTVALVLSAAVSERKSAQAALRSEKEQLEKSETERRRNEEEIRRLNADLEHRVQERTVQLEAINKELEAFGYSVSHDLRAPLRTIRGFSEVLLEQYHEQLDARGQDFLRRTCDASAQMDKLIDDLLKLSRVTRGEMQTRPVDLTSLAEDVAGQLKTSEPARAAEFVIAPGLRAYGDERLVRLVLDNLLRNAWKFSGKQPRTRIEVGHSDGSEPAFFVRDNGVGFDMTYAGKLFGVFQRLHAATEFPGSGVGLAIVQRIINRHGGRVWADSKVDSGATFYFTLPPANEF